MDNTNKEMAALLASIEHLMVANGLLEFKATEEFQPIESEELLHYLEIKDADNPDLSAMEDKVTELKITTCILRYLHKCQPENSKERNEQICQGALTTMRVIKLQLWRSEGHINKVQYQQLLRKQKRAEILAEAKYRAKTSLVGATAGSVAGVAVLAKLKSFGVAVDPETAGIIIAGLAIFGFLLGLFLPKDKIALLKKRAEQEIVPVLQDFLNKKVNDIKSKLPQELSNFVDSWLNKLKESLSEIKKENVSDDGNTVEEKAAEEEVEEEENEHEYNQ